MARILIIDDEANIRMMVRMALQRTGNEVEQAIDGPDGLAKFGRGGDWDLVLLDQRMPGMEGLEVMREIHERQADARVVMITAFGTIDLVVDAMKAGAKDFLRKPFTLETLYGAVEAALAEAPVHCNEPAATPVGALFSSTTLNGFRIESLREAAKGKDGSVRQTVTVRAPNGNMTPCEVTLPSNLVLLVRADTRLDDAVDHDQQFWQGLCEEAMATYVWQNSQVPFGGSLRVDEYSTSLRRWVLAATAAAQGNPAGTPVSR